MTLNFSKEIGGYFELDIKDGKLPSHSIALNTARNCLRYLIKTYNIKTIYAPYYTCPVVWDAIKKENCTIKFYHIDNSFMPTIDFPKNAFILYTNYFGICANNVKKLANKYKNLIIDNAQAFYTPKYGLASFNSLRKFFGVPDGAFLTCNKQLDEVLELDKTSIDRFSHLLKRIDTNAQYGYEDYKNNDELLNDEDIKIMSNLTKALTKGIDTENSKIKRLENFNFLHENLKMLNSLTIELDCDDVPMVYPLYIETEGLREKLIKNKIYIAKYWEGINKNIPEFDLLKFLISLPIDQRYNTNDMQKIINIIRKEIT